MPDWWEQLLNSEIDTQIALLTLVATVIGVLVTVISVLLYKRSKFSKRKNVIQKTKHGDNFSHSGTGDNVAGNKITINNKYDEEKLKAFAHDLAHKNREQDSERIKELEQAVIALSQQNKDKYDIDEALKLLSEGKPEEAEKIFELVALEAREKGQEAKQKWAKKEAAALRHIGSLAFLHNTQKALDSYKRSTELDPDNMSGWNQLGHLYKRIGELENAESAYMTVLKLAGSGQENQAVAYGNLGLIYQTCGELDRAVEFHEKALAIDQELGRKEGMANQYGNLGLIYQTRGELDRAVEFLEKSLAINQELGRKEGMAIQYGNLGLIYRTRGELDRAVEFHEKALAINQVLGNKEGMAIQYGNLGLIYQTRGELEKVVDYWKQSLALFTEIGAAREIEKVQSLLDDVGQ